MEDESIMELDTFILYNIILSIFFYTIYTQCIFRNLNGLNESGAKKIMIIIVFISLVVGIIFEQNRMNNRYAILNSSTPLGIYTAISYMPYRRYNILAFLISAIIITTVIMIFIFARKIKKRQYF